MISVSIGSNVLAQILVGVDVYGSRWNVEVFDGWDSPEIRQDIHHPVGKSGAVLGEWQYGPRTMTLEGHCWSVNETHMWDARLRLAAATASVTSDGLIWVTEPGENAYQIVIRRAGPLKIKTLTTNSFQYSLPIIAPDPRKYVVNTQTIHYSTPGMLNVFTAGTIDTPPTMTVHGPCNNPNLVGPNGFGGTSVVNMVVNVPSGQNLAVDFLNRTVTLNGVSRYDVVDPSTNWWSLSPGINQVWFLGSGGTADITWRDAWI